MWLIVTALILITAAMLLSYITIYSDNLGELSLCPPDYCASNIISGAKRCPAQGEIISRTSTAEVCNPRRSCNNPLTPKLLYDFKIGTVNNNFCPTEIPDEKCLCMNGTYCPVQYSSYFTPVGEQILTSTSYTNPIVRNVTVSERPFAPDLNNGSCTTASPERLWPPEFNTENRCVVGRLVLISENNFACMEIDNIECRAPNRITLLDDGSYSCITHS